MSIQMSGNKAKLEQLKIHLKTERYCASVQQRYPTVAERFLAYVESKKLAIGVVTQSDIENFLRQELRQYRKRHRRFPAHMQGWRWKCTRPVQLVLQLACGQWPAASAPATALEAFHRDVVQGYDAWMRDLRGLAPVTRLERTAEGLRFLNALGVRGDEVNLVRLDVREVDVYVQQRCVNLRRRSIKDVTSNLRAFLRYLHGSARTAVDLSLSVIGPRIYTYEDIPSALPPADIAKVLKVTRQDLSPTGRRDYAILMLLATYGLRAGEIVALRLQDLNWRSEILRIRHSKTGAYSELPLLRAPGEAILKYLKKGRPSTALREVFLRAYAPYRGFKNGTSLCSIICNRLAAAGVTPPGKKGPHAFRHARAVSLLRAAVPLKTIGDVLGHRSPYSTAAYLKLATEDLRAVGLEIPCEVTP